MRVVVQYMRPNADGIQCFQKVLEFPKHDDIRDVINDLRTFGFMLNGPIYIMPSAILDLRVIAV